MASDNSSENRRRAKGFLAITIVVALFLAFLSIVFFNPMLGPILVALLTILFLGIMKTRRPELFEALKKERDAGEDFGEGAEEPIQHQGSHRTYLMLIGLSNSNQHRVTINKSPFVIGSDDACDFKVEDKYVSRRHLIIEYDKEEKSRMVTDVSRNHTYLNGKQLEKGHRTPLKHGDTLQIGGIIFSVEYVHY